MAGEIPTDLPGILSTLGLPATALALAYGLVRGAEALEKDASEEALKFFSGLLKKGPLAGFGPLGRAVVPFVFDRVFGSRVISLLFIFRSIIISILFWVVLLSPRHLLLYPMSISSIGSLCRLIAIALAMDYLSLAKAHFILRRMASYNLNLLWTVIFVLLDLSVTFFIASISFTLIAWNEAISMGARTTFTLYHFSELLYYYISTDAVPDMISEYLQNNETGIGQIVTTSTMLTSVWVVLFLVSSIIVGLLAPLDHVRRFALWWFKDVDAHPLTAIAKVAAILIVIGAFFLKAARLGWLII